MLSFRKLLLLLTIVKLVLPFLLQHPFYQPHRDEFLYLAHSYHPAWGYLEVPPMLSWLGAVTNAMGASMFWIKIWPALFGAATFYLTGLMVELLGGKRFALVLAWLPFVLGAYLRLNFLFQPGFLELFWWTVMAYALLRWQKHNHTSMLYLFGVAAGFGMLSKYTTAFFAAGIVLALLATGMRKIFLLRQFWLAAAIGMLVWLPNLWWQSAHNWPIVHHMQELQETQLRYVHPMPFLISQPLMFGTVSIVWISGLCWCAFSTSARQYRWLALMLVFVLALLILGRGKDYYALSCYPLLFAAGAMALEKWTSWKMLVMRPALIALTIAPMIPTIPLALPVWEPQKLTTYYSKTGLNKLPFFKWEDLQYHPLPQDFADMIGWQEIADMTHKQYQALPDSARRNLMIYCRSYYVAGLMSYYNHRHKWGLPEAYSDNGSFLLWMPEKYDVNSLMMIGHRMPQPGDKVFEQFANRQVLDTLSYPLAREDGTKVFLFTGANTAVNKMIEEGIREEKAIFGY
jgi:hypothetical protein